MILPGDCGRLTCRSWHAPSEEPTASHVKEKETRPRFSSLRQFSWSGKNLAERVVKPFVIDRKNYLFSKSESGAEASATMMTVIRTALRNGLIPERYLTWLFENSNKLPTERLMPWSDDVPTTCKAFGK